MPTTKPTTEPTGPVFDEDGHRILNQAQIDHYIRILHGDPSRGSNLKHLRIRRTHPALTVQVANYLAAYEILHDALLAASPNPHKDEGEDWLDDEADVAMQQFRFWWTWGN